MSSSGKKRVAYYYDEELCNHYYGPGHPMKPHRIRMAHQLCIAYGLYRKMDIYRPYKLTVSEMTKFHADDYVHFLQTVNPENQTQHKKELVRYNVDFGGSTSASGMDCPVFEGLFDYCRLYAGGSVGGAYRLNHKTADIVINWSGGLHHAKKSEASGFCYINDIVLAILELLKFHERVLYIDIDIHHGDGVEEAFYASDRVMTVSFHKYGDYFPGTGDVEDIGVNEGQGYSINFPLQDGIDDEMYESVFKPVISKVMECYRPGAIVLQCGADSLAGDRLGCFNLTLKGHGACVQFVKSFDVPMLVLGGGGYTIRNVSKCWAYESAILVDTKLSSKLPQNEYYEYYCPDYELQVSPTTVMNQNAPEKLEENKKRIFEILRRITHAPSVQFHQADRNFPQHEANAGEDPDVRITQRDRDKYVVDEKEFYDHSADQDQIQTPLSTSSSSTSSSVHPHSSTAPQPGSTPAIQISSLSSSAGSGSSVTTMPSLRQQSQHNRLGQRITRNFTPAASTDIQSSSASSGVLTGPGTTPSTNQNPNRFYSESKNTGPSHHSNQSQPNQQMSSVGSKTVPAHRKSNSGSSDIMMAGENSNGPSDTI